MKNENSAPYGAFVERGTVVKAENGKYTVESCERPGVMTPPINGMATETYSAGDRVFFFLFDDGDGMIVGKMG